MRDLAALPHISIDTRTARAAWIALALLASCARHTVVHKPPAIASRDMDPAAIPPTPVAGALAGQRFRSLETWYRVVRMPGRERLDLIVSEGHVTRLCAESTPELSRHVWVRFPHVTSLPVGVLRVDPPHETPMSVHYEWTENEHWTGHGGGSAVVAIDEVRAGELRGRLQICFDDASSSCVSGNFQASECRNELDLDGPRGGPLPRAQDPAAPP